MSRLSSKIQIDGVDDLSQTERLKAIVETMRDMSRQTDPQEMVRTYGERMRQFFPAERFLAISRRGLEFPNYRVTRYSGWNETINPWKDKGRLPLLSGGVLADLIYGNEPVIHPELAVTDDDPAFEFLDGQKSLRAVPLFDQGESLNMVIATLPDANAFDHDDLPEIVWISNLFGRATHNLVLAEQLDVAFQQARRQMEIVGQIQRELLPVELPEIPRMKLAASYQTSEQAGGDYYDVFELPNGKWGILVADVSGHGTPAAVVMAMTHSIAHTFSPSTSPAEMLNYLNYHLAEQYTSRSGAFVTAFYAVFDPQDRTLTYSSAGHNPPRLKRCNTNELLTLDRAGRLPLGIVSDITYAEAVEPLEANDRLVIYTDGIIEAHNHQDEMFGVDRLDEVLNNCRVEPDFMLRSILNRLENFSEGLTAEDDRTLLIAAIS